MYRYTLTISIKQRMRRSFEFLYFVSLIDANRVLVGWHNSIEGIRLTRGDQNMAEAKRKKNDQIEQGY